MKLGIINRISKEDITRSGESPKWIDALLTPLNDFIEKVGKSLQGQLTFEDNFLCKIVSQSFTSGTEVIINPTPTGQRNLRVRGVLPFSAGGLLYDKFGWVQKPDGTIGVTFYFASGTTSTCEIVILLR